MHIINADGNVLEDTHGIYETRNLERSTYLFCTFENADAALRFSVDYDRSLIGTLNSGHKIEEGRLPRPVRTYQSDNLS